MAENALRAEIGGDFLQAGAMYDAILAGSSDPEITLRAAAVYWVMADTGWCRWNHLEDRQEEFHNRCAEYLVRTHALRPDSKSFFFNALFEYVLAAGDAIRIQSAFDKARKAAGFADCNPEANSLYGELLLGAENPRISEAVEQYQKALEKGPRAAAFLMGLGWAKFMSGDRAEALGLAREARVAPAFKPQAKAFGAMERLLTNYFYRDGSSMQGGIDELIVKAGGH